MTKEIKNYSETLLEINLRINKEELRRVKREFKQLCKEYRNSEGKLSTN
jgi:hypothetical protein